jgi:two-component system, chemotaxis family, chemotaxis protein CheY
MAIETPARGRVLVADDEVGVRVSLAATLGDAGYLVTTVSTGEAALKELRENIYDAAVLDLWMPSGDGLAVLRELRRAQPALRVFVITGGGPGLPIEAAALISDVWGAERVFIKPFDERSLVDGLAATPLGQAAPAEAGGYYAP